MALTEPERHEFHDIAKHEVGERFAELLMRSIPPNPDQLATRDDLALARSELRTEMAGVRTEMAELKTELRTDMTELRTEMKTEMAGLRTEMKTEMAGLRVDMADLRADVTDTISTAITAQNRTLLLGLIAAVIASNLATILA